jgi:hypothetical protein
LCRPTVSRLMSQRRNLEAELSQWRQSAGRSLAARGCMRQVPPVELATDPQIEPGAVPTHREICGRSAKPWGSARNGYGSTLHSASSAPAHALSEGAA